MMIEAFRHGDHNMCWFWRAAIAAGVGGAFSVLPAWALAISFPTFSVGLMRVWSSILGGPISVERGYARAMILVWALPTLLVTLAGFGLLTHFTGTPLARETRCRKCNYILRGITEPRCPECGGSDMRLVCNVLREQSCASA